MSNSTHFSPNNLDACARIVHDFKSPINIILSSAAMVRMKLSGAPEKTDDLQQYLHYIEQNCHRLLRLANSISDQAAQSSHAKLITSSGDIGVFLACVLHDLELYAEQRSIELSFQNHLPEPCVLNFDRDLLERILWNLLINGFKHTPRGGNLTISLSFDPDFIYISITDNGIGISPDELSCIFDPRTTNGQKEHSSIPSWGLGLPIVQELAELHGGTVFVSSTPDQGTCFTFSISRHLPLTMGSPAGSPL